MIEAISQFLSDLPDVRKADVTFGRRTKLDRVLRWLRSCAVCRSTFPPIDFLCARCWTEFDSIVNRGAAVKQADFVFPTYSLLTWTPQNDVFVRRFVYGFKRGFSAVAARKLALVMATSAPQESDHAASIVVPAPSTKFDHSALWSAALARELGVAYFPAVRDPAENAKQKQLRQGERGSRRYAVREDFANLVEEVRGAKRIIFADDVITSGSTAMAAYMALGDPDRFEVWTLAARPRLAGKTGMR